MLPATDRVGRPVKLDVYIDLIIALEIALVVADGILGACAWTPPLAGATAGAVLGYLVVYVLVEVLDRLVLIHGDRERLDRELAKGRGKREGEWGKRDDPGGQAASDRGAGPQRSRPGKK